MTFVLLYTVMLAMRGFSGVSAAAAADRSECGVRPSTAATLSSHRRSAGHRSTSATSSTSSSSTGGAKPPRHARIIDGSPTREGQFPWQVSLELLHPSLGFIGHWCGAVLIDQSWVLSAAHCIHNDLFNLPLPPLWTVVLGEYNRHVESGYEQRISVDRIVMHRDYENYQHDLVMIKLAEPADMGVHTTVRKICLPFIAFNYPQSLAEPDRGTNDDADNAASLDQHWSIPERDDNYLRSIKLGTNRTVAATTHRRPRRSARTARRHSSSSRRPTRRYSSSAAANTGHRRRNDKFLHVGATTDMGDNAEDGVVDDDEQQRTAASGLGTDHDEPPQDLPYIDCIATGWGKSTIGGDLTDILLQTRVPIHPNAKCTAAYGENVRIHRGHLCAGKLNGKGGTCVGDSGGPLQCRISKNGPWLLAGVTSFGSGCAEQGFPDVYSRISHYVQWITETMEEDRRDVASGRRWYGQ